MFNTNLYDVDIEISIHADGILVAKTETDRMAWIHIEIDNICGTFDLMGVSQMTLDFMDDDCIVFKKRSELQLVTVTVTKRNIAKRVGKMLQYLADSAIMSFDRDED